MALFPDSPWPLARGTHLGPYAIESPLGAGGMDLESEGSLEHPEPCHECPLRQSLASMHTRIIALAAALVGISYATGEGVPPGRRRGGPRYRLAADQGLARAQVNLGFMYATGEGVPQDDAEAVRWLRLAAEQGLARAQVNLGVMYATGEGVPQDYVEAHMWYDLAAAQSSGEDRDALVNARDSVAERMTAEQIAEAQRRAREWKPTPEP